MKKKAILLVAIVLASAMFIGGCTSTTSIKSNEEVGRAVTNVSQDVNDISGALQDIDTTLSSTP